MSDSFTEVTSESWFGRIGKSFIGVIVGLLLFVISFPLLWWNEGRAVHTAQGLSELGKTVVSVPADKVDAANQGKPVHITALATSDETLADPQFAVSTPALKLRRHVEMYQWKETKKTEERKKLGGGVEKTTTYTYSKVWADKPISSGEFHHAAGHENPPMKYESREVTAEKIHLGAFLLSSGLVAQLNPFSPLPMQKENLDRVPEELRDQLRLAGESYYLGKNPDEPAVGDLKISFQIVKPTEVSIIARQAGDSFEPWRSKVDTQVERLDAKRISAPEMVIELQHENTMLTWILRGVGFVLMTIGLAMVGGPLAVLADVLPFLGDFLRMGIFLFAALVAASLSLVTIALAWLAYRPVLGVALLIAAVVIIVFAKRLGSRKKALPPLPEIRP